MTAPPNILLILVDQMRWPCWLNSTQVTALNSYLPNIFGQIRNNSYVFTQYYAAATACTPSRATLVTGLYAPQTAMYLTQVDPCAPCLVSAFPTWASALNHLNTPYANNVWWFGKWHLSNFGYPQASPLAPYGFQTANIPGIHYPSPDGWPNAGVNGGPNTLAPTSSPYYGTNFASDEDIANDFMNWLSGSAGYMPLPGAPWCATLSLINPHDIAGAPGWMPPSAFPWYANEAAFYLQAAFPPATNAPAYLPMTSVYGSSMPSGWNWENQLNPSGPNYVGNIKPSLQANFINSLNPKLGTVTNWPQFLNQYYWLQCYVDYQIGRVLTALSSSAYANNTIVIFASDHGEYGGSHGMHDKAFAVYEESIHVPLYIKFPGQTSMIAMNQMCSSVDIFRLICDLATAGGTTGNSFLTQYPDQKNRQRIWSFLYANSAETRTWPMLGSTNTPYILHTTDERSSNEQGPSVGNLNHVVCLRGSKYSGSSAAKLAVYWEWAQNTAYPDTTLPQYEFYDYTTGITSEVGNNYSSTSPSTLQLAYENALGNWGSWTSPTPGQGIIAGELNAALTGTNGLPLSQAQVTAQQNYFTYLNGGCPLPS